MRRLGGVEERRILRVRAHAPPPHTHPPHALRSHHSGVALNSLADITQPDLARWAPAFRSIIDFIVDAFVGRAGGAAGLATDDEDAAQNSCGEHVARNAVVAVADHARCCRYCLVMLNDNVHSFTDVETLLQAHCSMSRPAAHAAALKIDEDGECIIFEGGLEHCTRIMTAVVTSCKARDRQYRRAANNAPLGVVVSSRRRRPLEVHPKPASTCRESHALIPNAAGPRAAPAAMALFCMLQQASPAPQHHSKTQTCSL